MAKKDHSKITNSENFKNWFGDSKVVDENGKPLVVYHGTTKDFSQFDEKYATKNTNENGNLGFFFTPDSELAEDFTRYSWTKRASKLKRYSSVIPVYLSIKNPKYITARQFTTLSNAKEKKQQYIDEGYDGIIITAFTDEDREAWINLFSAGFGTESIKEFDKNQYVAFYPSQIKSAYGNVGEFSPENPDMTMKHGGEAQKKKAKTRLVVYNGHTLGYILPELPKSVQVLHSSPLKGSPTTSKLTSSFPISSPDQVRLATVKDFEDFRVHMGQFANPEEYEYVEGDASFENWFKSSKVVDKEGNPLVVYHGSPEDFTTFDLEKAGTGTDSGMLGKGFYFSSNKKEAETYTQRSGKKGKVKPYYLSLQSPLTIRSSDEIPKVVVPDDTMEDMLDAPERYSMALRQWLIDNRFDGVISYISEDVQYVALYPEQIKLADGTNTTFNPNNSDIRMDKGGETKGEKLSNVQLKKGIEVEMEHSDTIKKIATGNYTIKEAAKMIAEDHLLKESPDYYIELEKMESKLDSSEGNDIELTKPEKIIEGQSYLVDPNHYMYANRVVKVVGGSPSHGAVKIEYYSSYEKKFKNDVINTSSLYELPAAVFEEGGEATIDERVEAYLKEREKGRKFKDTEGRVGGSAKEKRALSKILSYDEVVELKDEATEREILKKDRLLDKIDAEKEKEAGTTSGAAYLKNEMRKSVASKTLPEHKRSSRLIYAAYLNFLNQIMPSLKSLADIEAYTAQLLSTDHLFIEEIALMIEPESYKAYMVDRVKIDNKLKSINAKAIKEVKEPVLKWVYDNFDINEDNIESLGTSLNNLYHANENYILSSRSVRGLVSDVEWSLRSQLEEGKIRYTGDASEGEEKEAIASALKKYDELLREIYSEYVAEKREYNKNIGKHLKETAILVNDISKKTVIPTGNEEDQGLSVNYSEIGYWVEGVLKRIIGKKFYGFVHRSSSYHKDIESKFDNARLWQGLTKDKLPAYLADLKARDRYETKKKTLTRLKESLSTSKGLDVTGFYKAMTNGDLKAAWAYSGGSFAGKRKVKKVRGSGAKYWGWDDVALWSDKHNSTELIEAFKNRLETTWYNDFKKVAQEIADLDAKYAAIKPVEEDWSWSIKKSKSGTKTVAEDKYGITINSGKPLSRIIRKGGYIVKDKWLDSDEEVKKFLKEVLGIQRLEYGVSLPDIERKEHVRHFSQSIMDLHEILNWDMRTVIGWGIFHKSTDETYHGLGLQLASAGRGKALAHYMSSRTSINLTRKRGDGTVCHEYGHYLDNYFARLAPEDNPAKYTSVQPDTFLSESFKIKRRKYYYPSIDYSSRLLHQYAPSVAAKTKDIYKFIYLNQVNENRDDLVELKRSIPLKKIEVEIKASDNKNTYRNSWGDIPSKLAEGKDIKEIITEWQSDHESRIQYDNVKQIKDIVGQILKEANVPTIMLELIITDRETEYYSYSKRQGNYWQKAVELFARAFEIYIYEKLKKAGRENNYLVSGWYTYKVYPQAQERDILIKLFDDLMDAVKVSYNIPDFSIPSDYKMERGNEDIDVSEPETPKKSPKPKKDKPKEASPKKSEAINLIQETTVLIKKLGAKKSA